MVAEEGGHAGAALQKHALYVFVEKNEFKGLHKDSTLRPTSSLWSIRSRSGSVPPSRS
jgi:hypothetical protein